MSIIGNGECHFKLGDQEICSDDNILKQLSNSGSPILTPIKKKEIVEKLKADTNCESESCIYTSPIIIQKLGETQTKAILESNFKSKGPYDSTTWLNNEHIDNVLRQNMEKYKNFYAIGYQMIDFKEQKTELEIINIPYELKTYNTMGVVLNTDITEGKGKHWFAIFIDARKKPYTLEFFNSSGNLPVHQVQTWLNKTQRAIKRAGKPVKIIIVSPYEIQKSDTECGVFCLWFILSRLDGVPVESFTDVNMGPGDEKMIEYRNELFRHSH